MLISKCFINEYFFMSVVKDITKVVMETMVENPPQKCISIEKEIKFEYNKTYVPPVSKSFIYILVSAKVPSILFLFIFKSLERFAHS